MFVKLNYFVRKLNWKRAPSQVKTFRNYAHVNVDAFRKDLKGVTWNSAPGPDGPAIVDDLWHDFKRKFVTIAAVSYTHLTLPTIYSV